MDILGAVSMAACVFHHLSFKICIYPAQLTMNESLSCNDMKKNTSRTSLSYLM